MKRNHRVTITKSAQKLFARFGYAKTTVDEIARASRIGKATLYHYFRSKEDIFKEVIEKEIGTLNENVKEAIEKEETPQKKLKAYALTRMTHLNKLANIYSALKDEFLTQYAFIEKTREKDFYQEMKTVKRILEEGLKKNIFLIQDTELTSFAIISSLKGLEYPWSIRVSLPDVEKNIDKLVEILFHGILK